MGKIRRFKKEDWWGYAGSTKFKDGTNPFIYERELNDGAVELVIIADAEGVDIELFADDEPERVAWVINKSLNATKAEELLRAIVKELKKYTYGPDLSYELDHTCNRELFKDLEYIGE